MLFASLEVVNFLLQSKSNLFLCILGPRMPKSFGGHSAVQFGEDLYTFGGWYGYLKYETAIHRLSCSSRVCTWTTMTQQLKVARNSLIAIPVIDSLCVLN